MDFVITLWLLWTLACNMSVRDVLDSLPDMCSMFRGWGSSVREGEALDVRSRSRARPIAP